MREGGGGVNSSTSAYWLDNSAPAGLFSEAVFASTLFSVKHKFHHLLPNLVRGRLVCCAYGYGRPSSYMCEIMKHDN